MLGCSILVVVPKYIDLTAYNDENDNENIDDSFTDDDESILHVNIDEFRNKYIITNIYNTILLFHASYPILAPLYVST